MPCHYPHAVAGNLQRLVRDVMLNGVLASSLVVRPLRWRLLRMLGAEVSRSAISADVWLGSRRLAIGADTFINHGCRIDNTGAWIRIGRDCNLAPEVAILTATHELGGPERRAGPLRNVPVEIGNGVWIGARAVILPGVRIGDGAVIAAGAVVRSDCEPNTLYAGVPATLVRRWADSAPEGLQTQSPS